MHLSHCHCFKGEERLPVKYENSLDEFIWRAEKIIAGYPPTIITYSDQNWHNIVVAKQLTRMNEAMVGEFGRRIGKKKLEKEIQHRLSYSISF